MHHCKTQLGSKYCNRTSDEEFGPSPPPWDFDKHYPIPQSLRQFDYVYAAGNNINDVVRYWILPHNWHVMVTFSKHGKTLHKEMSIKDWSKLSDNHCTNVAIIDSITLEPIDHVINKILPLSQLKRALLLEKLVIQDVNWSHSQNPQIRQNGQIIYRLTIPIFCG